MKDNKINFYQTTKFYLLSALVFAVLGTAIWVYTHMIQDRDVVKDITSTLQNTKEEMDNIVVNYRDLTPDQLFHHLQLLGIANDDIALFVFKKDSLVAWSNHSTGNLSDLQKLGTGWRCLKLNNGYYLANHSQDKDVDLFSLFLIKKEYPYENNYLRNSFSPRFHLNTTPDISLTPKVDYQPIVIDDSPLLYVKASSDVHVSEFWYNVSWLLFLGFALFLIQGFTLLLRLKNRSWWYIPLFILSMLMARGAFFYLSHILGFDRLKLFSPEIYASSSWFPSLGDFLTTALFVFFTAQFIYKWIRTRSNNMATDNYGSATIMVVALYFSMAHGVNVLFKGLVEDSSISFNINNFFKLSPYSILGIVIVGFLLFSVYYLAQSCRILWKRMRDNKKRNQWLVGMILLFVLMMSLMGIVDWMLILWPIVLLIIILVLDHSKNNLLSVRIVLLTILTIYGSYMFEKYSEIKGKKKLVILSDKLSINNDIVAENLFSTIEKDMRRDTLIYNTLTDIVEGNHQKAGQFIDRYFKGYWNRYKINMFVFDSLQTPLFSTTNFLKNSKIDLDSSIYNASYSTLEGLSMVNPTDKHLSYLYRKNISAGDDYYDLYLEFEYKFVTEELGFPELLIKGNAINKDYSDYSVARYLDNQLISQKGVYPYLIDQTLETNNIKDSIYHKSGYLHYMVEKAPYTFVISKARDSWLNKITDFTYLYTIFGLMFILFIGLDRWNSGQWLSSYSLQIKIQTLVVSIVLISLLFFGLGSYYYIVSQNKEKNENLLREKVSSVLIELSHKLEKEKAMDDDNKIGKYLTKFSNVFFTDINIYALDGHLRASSRPQLFDQGIISTRMNPDAFYALAFQKSSRFTHNETIGNLNYISSYVPFYGQDNQVLAYLNLPYFAKQVELEQELSAFVVAIINMLVILFILSAFGALFVSKLITSPLKVIQDNLSGITLDRTNRPIQYSGKDEIGTLVNAYNDKLDELRVKAEELAKSERETAWREMAKQVAHEIKNPLTPMKLSIQYLQRTWKDQSDDWEDRFHRSTATLIEQIDTLSSIATAFGDFAKMPTTKSDKIDLRMILEQVIALFTQNVADADLIFDNELAGPQYIYADKDQITRVFNNLIKNAIQSIPQNQEGVIKIKLLLKAHQYIVEIEDNGTGIPLDKQDKIFVPNFTTKSTGTGLGLAMVKSIVENAGGKVWFTTKVGAGTSFFVSLKKESE